MLGHRQGKKWAIVYIDNQQPTTDTRQPGTNNIPPTPTPDNQQSALDDTRKPTTKNCHRQMHPIIKTDTRQPTINNRQEGYARQGWQRQPLHASYVTNLKPTMTDQQRQTDNDRPTTTDRQRQTDNDRPTKTVRQRHCNYFFLKIRHCR